MPSQPESIFTHGFSADEVFVSGRVMQWRFRVADKDNYFLLVSPTAHILNMEDVPFGVTVSKRSARLVRRETRSCALAALPGTAV